MNANISGHKAQPGDEHGTRTPEMVVADAIRTVTSRVQTVIESGHRSKAIDADDLMEILLTIASELDPEFPEMNGRADCGFCGKGSVRVDEACSHCQHIRMI